MKHACNPGSRAHLRILLPGWVPPSQNEEQMQHSSPSLSLLSAQFHSFNKKGSKWPTHMRKKWVTRGTLMGGRKMDLHSLGMRKASWVSLTAHPYVSHPPSALWVQAVTWKVKHRRPWEKRSSCTLSSPSSTDWGGAGCNCWTGPPPPERPREVIPSRREIFLGMLRPTKQAAGACPTISGASLPSGQLREITTSQAGLFGAKTLLWSGRIEALIFKAAQPRTPDFSQLLPNPGDPPMPSLRWSQWSTRTTHQRHEAGDRLSSSPGWAWLPTPCCSPCRTAFSKAERFNESLFMGLSIHWACLAAAGMAWFYLQFAQIPTNLFKKWKKARQGEASREKENPQQNRIV